LVSQTKKNVFFFLKVVKYIRSRAWS